MSSASGASAGGRRITIRSISCRGVRSFVPFQKPPLYAAVSLGGRREKTPPDPDGGENPDWDGAVVAFDLDGDGQQQEPQLVQFEVKAQVPLLGNKLVGTAGVPVADLAAAGGGGGGGDGAALRHVRYQVSAPDGKPNGTLSFAYAVSGGARPQPQLFPAPDSARPEQGPSFCCAPPSAAYPAPATANFAPHSGGYPSAPPPVSGSLYPPLQDLLPPSSYPPAPPPQLPTMTNPQFPAPYSSSYPPPPVAAYPPPPVSCTAFSAPPAHYVISYAYPPQPTNYITSYPPTPPTNYPPPPPSGYPPPAPTNAEFPASNLHPPTSTYPPPPPESGSAYPVFPRSAPSPTATTVDRSLPYYPAPPSQDVAITYPAPPGGSYYPPPATRHAELDGTARRPYYYPPPGARYP